ncbi:MAG: Gfo/Idh/MocA family oxidoreductase [Firmicutes bacterium]|nr:Gfo/Idh/MocA family oxidoreductase [Bacillota bacterium]
MKLGILGTGMIVHDFLSTYDVLNIEKAYIYTSPRSVEKTKGLIEKYNLDGYFQDYEEMLKADIDTIYVGLPNHLHYSFAKQALCAGKHVIMEKPVTSNIEELEDLIQISKEKNVKLFEAVTVHHMPAYKALKEKLNEIGSIKILNFNYSQYSSRYNAFKEGNILPAFDPHKSGGALMDINVYNINAMIGLFGAPQKMEYMANVEKGIDTSGIATLDYGNFKAIAIGAKDCKAPIVNTIQGDKGVILVEGPMSRMRSFKVIDNAGQESVYEFDKDAHGMSYEFLEFKRILEEQDEDSYQKLLEISYNVCKNMSEARKRAGILFDADIK